MWRQLTDLVADALPVASVEVRCLPASGTVRTAYLQVLGLVAVFYGPGVIGAVFVLAGQWPATPAPTVAREVVGAAEDLAAAAVAVWLVVLLAQRRGLTGAQLGWAPALPRGLKARQALAVGVLYGLAISVALLLLGGLRRVAGGAEYPAAPEGHLGALRAVTGSVNAGVVEELVLVAVLVTFLEQAGQPWWRILGVGLLARLSFHIYYGDPNTGLITAGWVLLWGAAALLLFRRTRRLTPLIVVHVLYDVHLSLLTTFGDGPDQVNIAVTMTLYFASILVWFVLFQQQRRGPECATPGPGPREGPRLRQRR